MPMSRLVSDLWPVTVETYHAMIAAGLCDETVELLSGCVVKKIGKNPPRKVASRRADLALSRAIPAGWHVTNQDPVTLSDSESEPDVMVVRGRLDDYGGQHPGPNEVGLVVEAADASLWRDRGLKRRLCAAAAIPAAGLLPDLPQDLPDHVP